MSANKQKQSEIKFDHDWRYCSTDLTDIDAITSQHSNDHLHWTSIQLPHLIDKTETEINDASSNRKTANWWYYKEFQWKNHLEDDHQRVHLVFQLFEDENNIDSSLTGTLTIWFNGIELFEESLQSPKISIDLTKQLLFKDESNKTNRKNTLIVCCKNAPLSFHAYLLVPHRMVSAIEEDDRDSLADRNSQPLSIRRNRVLDYIIGFNGAEGRFNIGSNSRLQSPIISKSLSPVNSAKQGKTDGTSDGDSHIFKFTENNILSYLVNINHADDASSIDSHSKLNSPAVSENEHLPDIIVSEDHQQSEAKIPKNKENNEDFPVPRLTIVMHIVGTRGDVQPFVAFGQTLLAAGHRVRVATHEKFRKYVRQHGLEFYPLASNPEDLMSFMVKNKGIIPSMSSIIDGDVKRKRRDISNILQSTWLSCTANDDETSLPFTAEVIIANPVSFGHMHCAQKLQIPLHMVFTMPWSPTTVFPHALCKVEHSKLSKEKMNLLSYSIIETLTWSGMSDIINDFRQETLGLPPLHTHQAIRMLIDEQVPHTYCWSPSFVPRPFDWPSHVNVAGYFFLKSGETQYQPADDLATFLGLNKENEEKLAPPIYIGFGSITGNDSHHLLQVILAALKETGYRALLFGFDKEVELPDSILKIGDTPHDWLFQHVSAVCHHGGAGTVAAGLRSGKPSIIIPFFGDQFFWGNVVVKSGAGPSPLPGKHVTVDALVDAFNKAHQPEVRAAAERIRDGLIQEDGCANALHLFHGHLPLSRMRSDLESTFPACYRVDELDLQVSRPVAQVLVAAGVLNESQFRSHSTQDWTSTYDHRAHLPARGTLKHTHKALSHTFIQDADGMKRAVSGTNIAIGVATSASGVVKHIGKNLGHLSVGVLSLYGEFTDVLERVPSLYGRYNEANERERPYVTDLKSGVKAAGLSLEHGWKDGIGGVVKTPRVGYRRDGLLGGAMGALAASANTFVKPTVGSLASVTWLGRGMYASITKKVRHDKRQKEHITINTNPGQFSPSLSLSSNDDADHNAPTNIKFAAIVSGYSTDVCQQILDEFEKVKKYQDEIASNDNHKPEHQHRIFRHRRHSDSAL